ncbi:MAG TPA: hypothetical protein DCP90_05135 [Clostridiales bacterium]|nr:MAG: hypothetical protein A2Y22_09070 [Clostridiales bacterium GWD2_32_59]HAN09983.1 hypothetical protein [Clostridiales bacterium]
MLNLVMLVVGGLLLIYNEKFCLYFLVLILPFIRASQAQVLCLIVGLLALKIVFRIISSKQPLYKRTFFDVSGSMLFVVWITTTLTSVSIIKSITDLIISTLGLLFCFICIQILEKKQDYINIITAIIISNVTISLYGLYQFFIEKPIKTEWVDATVNPDLQVRAYSVLGNPNILSQYLLLALPIGIMFMMYKKKLWHKSILAVFNIVILVCLLVTYSRASLLGLIVSLLTIGILNYTQALILMIPVAIIALIIFAPRVLERLLTSFNTKDTSISSRMTLWQDVIQIIKDYFLTGVGFGVAAFSGIYLFYKHQYLTALHAHNLYLEILAETGIIGFLVFAYFVFSVIINLMKNYVQENDKFKKYIVLGILAAFLGILVNGFAEYTWSDFRVVGMFWIVVGIGAALTTKRETTLQNN